PASCSFNTAIICSSVNLCFFIRPSFNGPDSNPSWRKFAVAGHARTNERTNANAQTKKERLQSDISCQATPSQAKPTFDVTGC
ncbi:hypothetical protein, partial [Rhizobium leguminosarum]|uniref:hypothetical protein n=1 Tax=Rhizobium leguminosarum TaxID=384 RepID=UPI0019546617